MFPEISSSLLLCQPAPSRTRTQWFPGRTEALARCSFMDAVLAWPTASIPFCARGSEKVDVAVAMVASNPRAVILACPQLCQHSRQFCTRLGTRPFVRLCRALPHLCLENSHGISPWASPEANAAKRDGNPASARRVPSMEFSTPKFVWILVLYVLNAPANQPVRFRAFLQPVRDDI